MENLFTILCLIIIFGAIVKSLWHSGFFKPKPEEPGPDWEKFFREHRVHGEFRNPKKSPYEVERYQSYLERATMYRLENDPRVIMWTKRHSIRIPWFDEENREWREYIPDFLVEYESGRKVVVEVKGRRDMDSTDVRLKKEAAEIWCEEHGMKYRIARKEWIHKQP